MPTDETWRVVERKLIFSDNRQIEIEAQVVELPDGRRVSPYYRISTKPSCAVVATTPSGDLVMLRQYKHGIGRVCLTFPGGRLEPEEDYLSAAVRELREETGYQASNWRSLGAFTIHANQHVGVVGLLRAEYAEMVTAPDHGDLESMEVVLVAPSDARTALADGRIGLLGDASALSLALTEGL